MRSAAVLYICTGKYVMFWEKFYNSSEKHFLKSFHKEYFVFSDVDETKFPVTNNRIKLIYQDKLGWPYDTMMRFEMFSRIKSELLKFDFLFFLNANMIFLKDVGEEILPDINQQLVGVKHPSFYNKERKDFTYEKNPLSLAYIPPHQGEVYFMGGFNGGIAKSYIQLIEKLRANINADLQKNIIAVWHDESHLNNYFLGRSIKILSSSYGYPQNQELDMEKIILILDKNQLGGHNFLRDFLPNIGMSRNWFSKILSTIFHFSKKIIKKFF